MLLFFITVNVYLISSERVVIIILHLIMILITQYKLVFIRDKIIHFLFFFKKNLIVDLVSCKG